METPADPADLTRELAHEIQAPLTTLELQLRSLSRELPQNRVVESCLDQVDYLKRLVTTFLELESGELRREALDLAAVLDAVEARFRPIADARGIELQMSCGATRAIGNARATERILANLVDNAIKFSSERGSVDVSARVDDGHVVLRVRDEGVGIAPDRRGLVFEPFYRVDRDVAGAGLGLAIARRLAEAQRGSLDCESVTGRGSSFVLTLPAA